jgi:hypothetical protein
MCVNIATQKAFVPEIFFTVAIAVKAVEQLPMVSGNLIGPGNLSDESGR